MLDNQITLGSYLMKDKLSKSGELAQKLSLQYMSSQQIFVINSNNTPTNMKPKIYSKKKDAVRYLPTSLSTNKNEGGRPLREQSDAIVLRKYCENFNKLYIIK